MTRPSATDRARVAIEAGVSVRTAERAYAGEDMRMSTLRALLEAAERLGVSGPPVRLPGAQEGGE